MYLHRVSLFAASLKKLSTIEFPIRRRRSLRWEVWMVVLSSQWRLARSTVPGGVPWAVKGMR
jgi:hypothetical protein